MSLMVSQSYDQNIPVLVVKGINYVGIFGGVFLCFCCGGGKSSLNFI